MKPTNHPNKPIKLIQPIKPTKPLNQHPYVWEIANMVRAGVMERDKGMEKIYSPENQNMVKYAKNKLSH